MGRRGGEGLYKDCPRTLLPVSGEGKVQQENEKGMREVDGKW